MTLMGKDRRVVAAACGHWIMFENGETLLIQLDIFVDVYTSASISISVENACLSILFYRYYNVSFDTRSADMSRITHKTETVLVIEVPHTVVQSFFVDFTSLRRGFRYGLLSSCCWKTNPSLCKRLVPVNFDPVHPVSIYIYFGILLAVWRKSLLDYILIIFWHCYCFPCATRIDISSSYFCCYIAVVLHNISS